MGTLRRGGHDRTERLCSRRVCLPRRPTPIDFLGTGTSPSARYRRGPLIEPGESTPDASLIRRPRDEPRPDARKGHGDPPFVWTDLAAMRAVIREEPLQVLGH